MGDTAFCFDLDGTLTRKEILPLIAQEVNLFEEINILTDITMKGLIPFTNSFKLRVKLLSAIPFARIDQIVSTVPIDQNLKSFILENKKDCFIVTGNLDVWIDSLVKKEFGCNYYSSKAEVKEAKLQGIKNILDKGAAVDEIRKSYSKIVAVGDGMNDCSMFNKSDVGIAFGGIHEPVESLIQLCDYVAYDSKMLVNLLSNLK